MTCSHQAQDPNRRMRRESMEQLRVHLGRWIVGVSLAEHISKESCHDASLLVSVDDLRFSELCLRHPEVLQIVSILTFFLPLLHPSSQKPVDRWLDDGILNHVCLVAC